MLLRVIHDPSKEYYTTQDQFLALVARDEASKYLVNRCDYLFKDEPVLKCVFFSGVSVISNITGGPIATPSNIQNKAVNESELANLVLSTPDSNLVAVIGDEGVRWQEEGFEIVILGDL